MNLRSIAPPHVIKPADSSVARLVQITDSHVFADAETCLRGMNTRDSLEAVCRHIADNHSGLDAILATGDLSQDESVGSYRYLAAFLDGLGLPTFWLPGNHDDSRIMARHFQAEHIHPAKQLLIDNWQILLLDSTIKGETHGRVAAAQLDTLDHTLQEYPDKHALVCLHHQALDVGSRWIDDKGLRDSDQLRARLAHHPQIRAVLWGSCTPGNSAKHQ